MCSFEYRKLYKTLKPQIIIKCGMSVLCTHPSAKAITFRCWKLSLNLVFKICTFRIKIICFRGGKSQGGFWDYDINKKNRKTVMTIDAFN